MDHILSLFHQNSGLWSYVLLFLVGFIENAFPPVPGDTVIVVALVLIGKGWLNFWIVLASASTGGTLGFLVIYSLTFWGKDWVLRQKWLHFGERKLEKTERWFKRYSLMLILGNRLVAGFRTVVAFVAGLSGIPFWKMAILSFIGISVWNAGLLMIGSQILTNKGALLHALKTYNLVAGIVILAGIGIGIFLFKLPNRMRSE